MKKKMCVVSGLVAVTIMLGACGTTMSKSTRLLVAKSVTVEPEMYDVNEQFVEGYLQFSFETLQRCSSEATNLMISPLSIQTNLAMLANGSDGTTKEQFEKVLTGTLPVETYSGMLASYTNSLYSEKNMGIQGANSIWFRDSDDLKVEEAFLAINSELFGAESYASEFSTKTASDINKWVSKNTKGRITHIIDEVDKRDALILLNALCFDEKWEKKYEKKDIWDGSFTNKDGSEVMTEMLHGDADYYLWDPDTRGFIKNYKDGYGFVVLLPEKGKNIDIDDYVAGLDAKKWTRIMNTANGEAEVHATFPTFKTEYETDLVQTLKDMGMTDMFLQDKADFSGIAKNHPLFTSIVLHKTMIEVDEAGTKAAAVTLSASKDAAGLMMDSKEVIVDRPFVYAIIDNENKLPIFIGVIKSMK